LNIRSSDLKGEKFFDELKWSASEWETKFANLEKRDTCVLENIHHVSWSKKLLHNKKLHEDQELDLHGTDLCNSVEDLVVLLPLSSSTISKLDLR
jgi:hypothetical protein